MKTYQMTCLTVGPIPNFARTYGRTHPELTGSYRFQRELTIKLSRRFFVPHTATRLPHTNSQPFGQPDRLSVAPDILFVYGSLQFIEVLHALLRRVPKRIPANAVGWRVVALRDRVYPGLVPATGAASGLLIPDLTANEWAVLDEFEDPLYELRRLEIDEGRHGWAYICEGGADVCSHDWDPKEFASRHLERYSENCHGWRLRYDAQRAGPSQPGAEAVG
jgi:gamma-glutamylcyclotransferase (GGCT)/AIG2-like uncharacterized protein YtfP